MAGFLYAKPHPNDFYVRKDCQYQITPKLNSPATGSEGCKELLHFPSPFFQQRITVDHKIHSVFCRIYKQPTSQFQPLCPLRWATMAHEQKCCLHLSILQNARAGCTRCASGSPSGSCGTWRQQGGPSGYPGELWRGHWWEWTCR